MIYLYAIADQPEAPLPDLTGLEDNPLFSLADGDIAAVVSTLSEANGRTAPKPVDTNLWQHEAVLEALMNNHSVLPVSYGATFANEAALKDELATHHASFVAGLNRIRGRVEFSLRILWEVESKPHMATDIHKTLVHSRVEPASPATTGRDYLFSRLEVEHQRQALRRQAEELVAELHAPLDQVSIEHTHQILLTPRMLLKAAYLVERQHELDFGQEIKQLSQAYPDLRFLCTGPWPPYNFVAV
jgi:hypothetical protein